MNQTENNRPLVDGVPALERKLEEVRRAQEQFATFSQEQVDRIFQAAALAANHARLPLAKMAVEETGMGVVEDKVIKNNYAAEYIYNAYKHTKTCGIIEQDPAYGTMRIAEPIGVVAAVIPTTNPTSTAIFKSLICLKTRNAIIISPHPRAKKSTIAAAKIVLDAAVKAGAPENIIGWIDVPSLEMTNTLMQEADIILATGGPGMVRAAYSSGKPALGVGAGNTPAVIDASADIQKAVNSIVHSKTFDNGMICASEQSVIVDTGIYDTVRKEFQKRGCYFLTPEETEKVRKTILINGALNSKIVGQRAAAIAGLAGVTIPQETRVLIGEVTSVDISEEFAHEKLSPVLAMYRSENFEQAVAYADQLIRDGGYGHTASLYVDEVNHREKIDQFAARMKACRIVINTPSSHGGIGDLYNFNLAPSLTLGCGSWGGNSVSENVGVKHLLNIKTVAERRENMLWFRTPQKVYFKKGCLPVALREIEEVLHRKRAFLVTDEFLFKSGKMSCITEPLQKMGIPYQVFSDVQSDPTLACAKEGAELMRSFQPDVIIALGGGSAMDAAKIMWVLYEHPDADFADMAMRFLDIRKRTYEFPEMGEKAYFIAVPTSSGTGSEVPGDTFDQLMDLLGNRGIDSDDLERLSDQVNQTAEDFGKFETESYGEADGMTLTDDGFTDDITMDDQTDSICSMMVDAMQNIMEDPATMDMDDFEMDSFPDEYEDIDYGVDASDQNFGEQLFDKLEAAGFAPDDPDLPTVDASQDATTMDTMQNFEYPEYDDSQDYDPFENFRDYGSMD